MSKRNSCISTTVNITSFTKKGNGLGTIIDSDKKVEVPFAIPKETVKAIIHRKKSGVYASKLEEIITPSELRIPPRCQHFSVCGGCRWQQMKYEKQLEIKQEIVQSLFSPILDKTIEIKKIIPSESPWHYRNKMEFSFSSDLTQKKYLGLIIDSSRGKVVNLTECHLVNPWFIEAIQAVRSWWHESEILAYHPHTNKGSLRTLTVREGMSTGDRLVMLTVSGNPDYALNKKELESFKSFLVDALEPLDQNCKLSLFLRIQQAIKGEVTHFYEMCLYGPDHIREVLSIQPDKKHPPIPLKFDISPSAFFQPNTRQAEKLYSTALQLLDIPDKSVVYDLYCGTGTLGICAAQKAHYVLGIEISEESSLDARTNAKANGLKNIKIVTGSVRSVIDELKKNNELPLPDVVMLDPPRVGLDKETLEHLGALKPKKILYISCNPLTQVENIISLQKMGYQIIEIQPVDQFPHTAHIENIVVLKLLS